MSSYSWYEIKGWFIFSIVHTAGVKKKNSNITGAILK